ncbi:hypothetical protein SUGI_0050260 [Cryptomeria japonica]|nr:hypothetical protein SUGI_0050260 [Cryptomeria japonica]
MLVCCGAKALKGSSVVPTMILNSSTIRGRMQGLSQNWSRVWVHTNGYKKVAVSDMDSEKPKVEENEDKYNKFLTLPNILTLGRVAAVPLLIVAFYLNGWWETVGTTSIFMAAAATDWLDGYIARRTKSGSAFGAFLDPVADKLIVATTLVLLCTRPVEMVWIGQASWLLPVPAIAIIGREITMSAVREWAAAQGSDLREAVAVNNLGKWKTASQMIALTILLATSGSSQGGPSGFVASGVVMLYVSAGLGLWSLAVYMRGIWRILLK